MSLFKFNLANLIPQNSRILIFSLLVTIQIIIITYLIALLFLPRHKILGESVKITPLLQSDYPINKNTKLNYFYEPAPSSIRTDTTNWLNSHATYKFNSQTLNEDQEFSEYKVPGTFRTITLGDSFTFGLFIDPEDNYSNQLEKLQNLDSECNTKTNFEVINLGVPGYDLSYAIERFKLRGQQLRPDLVIWLIKEDDIFQVLEQIKPRSEELRNQLLASGEQAELEKKGVFYAYIDRAMQEVINRVGASQIFDLREQELTMFNNYYQGDLLIFSIPTGGDSYQKIIENFASTRDHTNYFSDFPKFNNSNQLLPDLHPSTKGHRFIAENLMNYMKFHELIPCN